MQVKPHNRYDLRDVHKEIDLFDRKIAHCQEHEKFESDTERSAALQKLVTKRETLVKVALDAVSRGIESETEYLPRSFKTSANAIKV